MPLSLVYGSAFEVPADDEILSHPSVHVYHVAGRFFVGSDTDDIGHVCGRGCIDIPAEYTASDAGGDGDAYAYVNLNATTDFATIDVIDFDPGDDPYILCETCEATILRDDAAYEVMFGRPIGEPVTASAAPSDSTLF